MSHMSRLQSCARALVCITLGRIQHGRLTIISKYGESDDKDCEVFGGKSTTEDHGSQWNVTIVFNSPTVWVRMLQAFDLGFAESYMLQELDCDNLIGLFSLCVANGEALGLSGDSSFLHRFILYLSSFIFNPLSKSSNDAARARRNASFHYDTSNELFSAFLSPDMNYSSALWSESTHDKEEEEEEESLQSAQRRKIHNLIDKACISSSDHVLDIGCGWGDLAIEAVRRTGCRVTGLTLSAEQLALAQNRVKSAGLEDRVRLLLCDYRQAPKPDRGYDRVVSVEMLEHVGDRFLNRYFESISALLKEDGGIMVVQGITIIHPMHQSLSSLGGGFLDRYIFPGGYLPTINQLLGAIHVGSRGTLEVQSVQSIGPHYIKTLQCWRQNFLRNWARSVRIDFVAKHPDATEDEIEAFRRKWLYYFMYCEAGFRTRVLDDYVVAAVRTPQRIITDQIL